MHKTVLLAIVALLIIPANSKAQTNLTANNNKNIFKVIKPIYTGKWILKNKVGKRITSLSSLDSLVYVVGKGAKVTKMIVGQRLDSRSGRCSGYSVVRLNTSGHKFIFRKYFRIRRHIPITIRILKAINTKTGKEVDFTHKEIKVKITNPY